MTGARCNHTFASFAAKNKPGLDHAHNGKSFGVTQHTRGDAFFRHATKIANDRAAVIDGALFIGICGDECDRENG